MSLERLHCVVVGFGKIGEQHLRAYLQLPRCTVDGVVEPSPERRQVAERQYGVRAWAALDEALAATRADVVSVCTPDFAHVEPTLRAAEAGAHVFLEKPLAMSLAEAEEVVARCRQAGVRLGVGFKMRFEWMFARVKWLVDHDAIGEPTMVYLTRPQRAGRQTKYATPLALEFADLCHEIDMATWLLGAEPVSVYETAPDPAPASRMLATLVHERGRMSSLYHGVAPEFPNTAGLYDAKLHIVGTRGHILGERPDRLWICAGTPPVEERLTRIDPAQYAQAPFDEELRAFTEALLDGRDPPVSGTDGLRAARVADAAIRSLSSGRAVSLTGAPIPVAST